MRLRNIVSSVIYPPYHIDYTIDLRHLGGKGCHKWREYASVMKHIVFMHEALGKFGFFQEVNVPAFEPEHTEPTPHSWHSVHGYGELPNGMINIYWKMEFPDEFQKEVIKKCLMKGGEKVKFLDIVRKKLAEANEKRELEKRGKDTSNSYVTPVNDGKHSVNVSKDSVKIVHWKRDIEGLKQTESDPRKKLVMKKRVRNGKVEYYCDIE